MVAIEIKKRSRINTCNAQLPERLLIPKPTLKVLISHNPPVIV